MQVVLLELNEVNLDYLRVYAAKGALPHLGGLIEAHGVTKTISEQRYEELEPWIQWVTAHTGLTYREHNVFRLGDIVRHDIDQIWERLEEQGLRIGAISPMNAKNRTRNAEIFLPDPWTQTTVSGGTLAKRLYDALAQAVNDNAQSRITARTAAWLLAGLARYARPSNYGSYLTFAATVRKKPWRKAMFLDQLLSDVFIREARRTAPHFISLFLNGAAHIQHHYMFNSLAYTGKHTNPRWYITSDEDPVGEVYRAYDRIVGQVRSALPRARLLIATGLHQEPHESVTFYWRLKEHASYLRKIGVPFERVTARMSRDFTVECSSARQAADAERVLASAKALDGTALFEIDNRGRDLFVMLTWPNDIDAGFTYAVGDKRYADLSGDVAFVAIKNGEHNGIGYLVDTGGSTGKVPEQMPLKDLPQLVCQALGVEWQRSRAGQASQKHPQEIGRGR